MLFAKAPNIVIGPGVTRSRSPTGCPSRSITSASSRCVIGTPGFRIPRTEAKKHVFGYTIMNDVTARDLQRGDKQWFRGKSCNTFAPMGPLGRHAGRDRSRQRGGHAQGQRRSPPEIEHQRPDFRRALPDRVHQRRLPAGGGDIISTGTPGGVGMFMTPPGGSRRATAWRRRSRASAPSPITVR